MNDHTKDRHAALGQVIQFQARNELHRHFPYDCRPRKPAPKRIAKRAAVVALVMGFVYAVLRYQLWDVWIQK